MSDKHHQGSDANRTRRQALRTLGMAGTFGVASLTGTGTVLGDRLDALVGAGQIQSQQADQLYTQVQKLTASDSDSDDEFGFSAALSDDGTTALIGAIYDDTATDNDSGAAYVYDLSGVEPTVTKLTPSSGENHFFGISVALNGDGTTAIVGAYYSDLVYLYDLSNDEPVETRFTATDAGATDWFGSSVALSDDGTTALIGAAEKNTDAGTLSGSAYVYDLSGDSPVETQKLTASDGERSDRFGRSASLSRDGTTALIGTRFGGSAYVYDLSNSEPVETKLTPDGGAGQSVSLSGDGATALVSANQSAYIYELTSNSLAEPRKITASEGYSDVSFASSVALNEDGTIALIGASGSGRNSSEYDGSAYVYDLSGSTAIETKLTASDGQGGDAFGRSAALSENGITALIGASRDDIDAGTDAGSAYVFARSGEPDPVPIEIEVKPDREENPINPRSRGLISVVVHGTDDFDVNRIDANSLRFDATDTLGEDPDVSPAHEGGHIEDVDGDGIDDLVLHFPTQETQIDEDGEVTLLGRTDDGTPIRGTDEVSLVGEGQRRGQGP